MDFDSVVSSYDGITIVRAERGLEVTKDHERNVAARRSAASPGPMALFTDFHSQFRASVTTFRSEHSPRDLSGRRFRRAIARETSLH